MCPVSCPMTYVQKVGQNSHREREIINKSGIVNTDWTKSFPLKIVQTFNNDSYHVMVFKWEGSRYSYKIAPDPEHPPYLFIYLFLISHTNSDSLKKVQKTLLWFLFLYVQIIEHYVVHKSEIRRYSLIRSITRRCFSIVSHLLTWKKMRDRKYRPQKKLL